MTSTIRIGTRGSALARWQANWVADALRRLGHEVSLVTIATTGDQQAIAPISALAGVGIFTKEIQQALLAGPIDIAVHSLKDLPTEPVPGLALAAVPARESVADVLVSRGGAVLEALSRGATIGTGSLRRRSQLLHVRPDLQMVNVRGNVDTRLRKLDEGECDALILAEAGLKRLGLTDRITQVLPASIMLPAPGQGALGLETRDSDVATRAATAALSDPSSQAGVLAERAVLRGLGGGCLAAIGAWGRVGNGGRLTVDAVVLSPDGARRLYASATGELATAEAIGQIVAEDLLRQGAAELIAAARTV